MRTRKAQLGRQHRVVRIRLRARLYRLLGPVFRVELVLRHPRLEQRGGLLRHAAVLPDVWYPAEAVICAMQAKLNWKPRGSPPSNRSAWPMPLT
jgi:hypothetical protein